MNKEIVIKKNKIQLQVHPFFLVILVVMIVLGYVSEFVVIYACMIIHELGHCTMAFLQRKNIQSLRMLPIGLNVLIEMDNSSLRQNTLIYASGPMTNGMMGLAAVAIQHILKLNSQELQYFIIINTYLAVFNLLPILPLDGGRILKDMLTGRLGFFLGSRYLSKISLCFSSVLIIAGSIQLFYHSYNFSLFILGVYTFFTLKVEEMEAALMNIKHVVYRRARIFKKGIYPARDLVAIKTVHLREVLKFMDFDQFHFIYVMDENLNLLKIFTEQDVVDAMLKYNPEMTLDDLIKKTIQPPTTNID